MLQDFITLHKQKSDTAHVLYGIDLGYCADFKL